MLLRHTMQYPPSPTDTQTVTLWEVKTNREGQIDYGKLIDQFGCSEIDSALIDRFENVTGKRAHPLLRRGMFFIHRDFNLILDAYERREPFYIYRKRTQ